MELTAIGVANHVRQVLFDGGDLLLGLWQMGIVL
jgi:hypothetical protein